MGVDGKPRTGNSLMAVDDAVREKTCTSEFVVIKTCGIDMSVRTAIIITRTKKEKKEKKEEE
jgi:hypothetical protein